MNIFHHLFRPFGYLSIKGVNGKVIYDWFIPLALTVISLAFFLIIKFPFSDLYKDGGLIKLLSSFISNLPGFYIAALAAIATFNRKQIDYPLINDNGNPYIYVKGVKENGRPYYSKEDLTRRLFLCMLFSFLTALSILIIVTNAFLSPVIMSVNNNIGFFLYASIFLFFTWQLLVSTFFGLYYLGDRIHMNK
ncbi:hypothetical protein I2494_20130 [Budviciaceae bacterium BWR-B9]|uniref:DUF4013 domain-containing protein n=1 Tax=Limnobaculum allomyrinae TaxID=2791986 RepID=A0ABS1IWT7_9GAMM|nr:MULTISPECIES: hypothetical protein [Limnobaculum]MBK5145981.1 hypothetical protein [Limnobaculum allomyrinae]MBV7694038.1 hypothetical protein [Limnobaculum sp. M2-1]